MRSLLGIVRKEQDMTTSKALVLAMPEGFEVHIDLSERPVADREALANGNTHANFDVCCGGSNCGC